MQPRVQVLSEEERLEVHARSLEVLKTTGVRVESRPGLRILHDAGASVDERELRARVPEALVGVALQACAKDFTLGGRRPGWSVRMNAGECTLCADGTAVHVLDLQTDARRPGTLKDWEEATRLIDALDEVGIYWTMIDPGLPCETSADWIANWRRIFSTFSKHVQDGPRGADEVGWLLEVLQVIFGSREDLQRLKPFSFLLCPLSPLVLEGPAVDACLAAAAWGAPIAIMPMPLMGATAPASLISTLVLANAEVLAAICLIEAAHAGTPCLYAPVPALVNPRTWRFGGGEVEHALLGAAVTEMARFYGLPAESSTGGTDEPTAGLQSGYETALNWSLPMLSWPDILIGPGLLEGSTVLCLEQILIDIELFRRGARLHRGIESDPRHWLHRTIERAGPGGSFLKERSTRDALRTGEWYQSALGFHDTWDRWQAAGKPTILQEARDRTAQILGGHTPLPLSPEAERELDLLEARARGQQSGGR
jgi:trimethylamine--corrinoid protein Co-methyltransferase